LIIYLHARLSYLTCDPSFIKPFTDEADGIWCCVLLLFYTLCYIMFYMYNIVCLFCTCCLIWYSILLCIYNYVHTLFTKYRLKYWYYYLLCKYGNLRLAREFFLVFQRNLLFFFILFWTCHRHYNPIKTKWNF
jgi:hypothetical protein